jgi:ubiquinone/menaquinone biosynthesis C-methylase UbiE
MRPGAHGSATLARMATVTAGNQEAVEAWNGVLFDRFSQFRHLMIGGLAPHGHRAMAINPPGVGARVLDIGCGFGDTTQELATLVGPDGSAVGIDAAPRFIEAANREAEEAGAENVSFVVGDPEAGAIEGEFDYAFSRMGTMFFANPVAALRNVRAALTPGARLSMVVWRRKDENPAFARAEQVVERFVDHPDPSETDEPTCGPGPFSMANPDTVSAQLLSAGFTDVSFLRSDEQMLGGRDLDEAVALLMALGPAGEVIRLAGENAERLRTEIGAAIREMLSEYEREDGVWTPSSTWIVSASVPA